MRSSSLQQGKGLQTRHQNVFFKQQRPQRRSSAQFAVQARQAFDIITETAEAAGKVLTGRAPQSPFHTGKLCMGTDKRRMLVTIASLQKRKHGSTDITTAGTASLVSKPIPAEKYIVLIRHGLTTWNESKQIQGDSDRAILTELGESQAKRCRDALSQIPFDSCFSSPIQRAWRFAQLAWSDRQGPLIPMDNLKEAHLGWLQGMKQEEAATKHEEVFRAWREQPADFEIGGRRPVDEVFTAAKLAWEEMLLAEGSSHLVVTHKSILRALLCVAMGLPTIAFRAVDIHNGGVCAFRVNKRGEPMLINLNQTAHMHTDGVHY